LEFWSGWLNPAKLMLAFTIKICGITDPRHAVDAMRAGADAIGLNFFQSSKRSVSEAQAGEIIDALDAAAKAENCRRPAVVGVFVNHRAEEIYRLAKSLRLDGIQLHGDETPDFFKGIEQAVDQAVEQGSAGQDFPADLSRPFFVRAIRTQPAGTGACDSGVDCDPDSEAKRVAGELVKWSTAGVDLLLLDAAATGEFGGTGKTIDWSQVPNFQAAVKQPIVLAGGLNASNVAQAIAIAGVRIVDVASGVESEPGQKDAGQVQEFSERAMEAFGKR
jgi:phosphoribosylanthranilate isomerase